MLDTTYQPPSGGLGSRLETAFAQGLKAQQEKPAEAGSSKFMDLSHHRLKAVANEAAG